MRAIPILAMLALSACGPAPGPETGQSAPGAPRADLQDLARDIAALEQRKSLIEDANDVKRLQRTFGYYFDEALWDDIVDLFAEGGSIEMALDGVYVGKARIREYLYARGGGRSGLSQGRLNEHMQLMPVVTVAPDGKTAKARWRAIIMGGEHGAEAYWGEGPYENEYVKQDGIWKLSKIHWFQSMLVPYAQGWQHEEDLNGGRWVTNLRPDRPPTIEYDTWPSTYLPPFHFPNPVLGARPAKAAPVPLPADSLHELAEHAAVLAHEVGLLEDENAIENLQRSYGFYIDEGLWTAAAELFADDGTLEIGASGVFVGKERVLELLRAQGPEFPQHGQPVVHVAPDGRSARARWRLFAQEAVWGDYAYWGAGVLENEYVKDGDVWKIQSLHVYQTFYTPYEDGWGKASLPLWKPSRLAPDRPPSIAYEPYPAVFVVPFHYQNPVTGAPVYAAAPAEFAAPAAASRAALEALLEAIERRVTRLEDFDALERLNAVYGYYLARNQWDNLTGIFAPDGSIEIAMRGVYVGAASVRRNLDLYGAAGIHHGLLHNHMQYQPVISVAEDGRTAKMRSRAFSIMGQHEAYAMWMGGVYENELVKPDGIWQIARDQVFNTYFVPYAVGFKDAVPRPPPGITDANPPDLPPTTPFEMYPSPFLVPFHYRHPVTGEQVTGGPGQ